MQAAQYIEYDSSFGEEEEQAKVLEVSCSLNNVVCKLKLKNYKQAENIIRTLYGTYCHDSWVFKECKHSLEDSSWGSWLIIVGVYTGSNTMFDKSMT